MLTLDGKLSFTIERGSGKRGGNKPFKEIPRPSTANGATAWKSKFLKGEFSDDYVFLVSFRGGAIIYINITLTDTEDFDVIVFK